MPISINNPIFSTTIFIVIFIFALLISLRRKKSPDLFPKELTRELKGLAILAIVFSHIGYFLVSDHRFMFPLSIMAGVGVNLFLFLSGYGLTISALRKKLPIEKFYKKRLLKLFTPFWIVVSVFFLLDYFILHISYSWPYIIQTMLGFFPRADLVLDVNSPFWFLTLLLFYYLIFPLVFSQKRPWLTPIIVYIASFIILQFKLPVSTDIQQLYQNHLLAFPLGIAFASLFFEPFYFSRLTPASIKASLYNLEKPFWLEAFFDKFKKSNFFRRFLKSLNQPAYYTILITLLFVIAYFAYYSGVGENPVKEQAISLLTMAAIIFFFIMKKMEIKLFYLFGFYSYEIYLLHWPLMSRYDFLFKNLPGWLAMILYLGFFLALSFFLKKIFSLGPRLKK